jgi:hypothetical protein
MAIEEEYGFGIINEGQAIAVARNVKVRPNEFAIWRWASSTSQRGWLCPVSGTLFVVLPGFSLSLADPPPSQSTAADPLLPAENARLRLR